MKPTITLAIIIAIAFLSFLLGRASVNQTSEIVYIKGKEIRGNAPVAFPTKEIQPITPILPFKYVFIENTKTEVVDTAKIIQDYIAERTYSVTLFDNLHGRLDISPTIQYNKLSTVPFTFSPIEKVVYKKQKLTFFTTASYNTFNIAGVGLGVFYNNRGLHYRYLWNTQTNDKGHELGVNIMF